MSMQTAHLFLSYPASWTTCCCSVYVNSLEPERFAFKIKLIISKLTWRINILSISSVFTLKSLLMICQLWFWYGTVSLGNKNSYYLNQCCPDFQRHMDSLGRNWSLQWRHNEHDSVSNHQRLDCLLNCLFWPRSKKTSKLRVTGLCGWNSPVTGEFHAQRASNAENVSIWWRHHVNTLRSEHKRSIFSNDHFQINFLERKQFCLD